MPKEANSIATSKDLRKVNVKDSSESLVNITKNLTGCITQYEKMDMLPYTGSDIWVRSTVAEKLKNASAKLTTRFPDYRLKITYGYRHPAIQEHYFRERKKVLRENNQAMSGEELNELTHMMVALPEIAGHPTGGALDITISTKDGDLDMGTKIADYSDIFKIRTFDASLSAQQKTNRQLLHEVMTEEGFAPFYGEWWHFSYGDKEWAWFYEKPYAVYDQIDFKIKE
jgi:zinc D-Ala-D-Ala dipeptidase